MSVPPRLLPLAARVTSESAAIWEDDTSLQILGTSEPLADALSHLARLSEADLPLVITGESGVGKGLFARAAHVLSPRRRHPFVRLNCSQFADQEHLLAELVGVASGGPGAFEQADGGTLLLDEVDALPPRAQAALLRALDQSEVTRLGEATPHRIDVRLVATARGDLRELTERGDVHEPLLNRLQRLRLHVPALRERGEDWRLIADDYLERVGERNGDPKPFAPGALDGVAHWAWPGNIHEVHAMVEMAYWSARGPQIEAGDLRMQGFVSGDGASHSAALELSATGVVGDAMGQMERGEASFWSAVRDPYLDRELNRSEVRQIVRRGLDRNAGSYKRALGVFGLHADEYLRFMDFLRHHRLKPRRSASGARG